MVTDPSVVRSVSLIGLAELIAYRTEAPGPGRG